MPCFFGTAIFFAVSGAIACGSEENPGRWFCRSGNLPDFSKRKAPEGDEPSGASVTCHSFFQERRRVRPSRQETLSFRGMLGMTYFAAVFFDCSRIASASFVKTTPSSISCLAYCGAWTPHEPSSLTLAATRRAFSARSWT